MSQSNSNNQRNNRNRSNKPNNTNRNKNGKNNYKRNRKTKQKPLTWWQKFLKSIGLLPSKKKQTKRPSTKSNKPKSQGKKTRNPRPQRDDSNANYSATRLYIGNLSYDVNDYDLEELFKGVGNLKSAQVAYNRHTQKSRGYGFIEFLDPADSSKAIAVLHEQYFMGRKLLVSAARERKEKTSAEEAS